jgi:hypothetical protein
LLRPTISDLPHQQIFFTLPPICDLKLGRAPLSSLRFHRTRAIQAANVLNSRRAIAMGVYVVRAFVQLREIFASNKDLARKLIALERSLLALDIKTQRQF